MVDENQGPEDMGSKVHDIVAEIAAGLASPRVLATIDRALGEFQQAQLALMDLRKTAVRLHGDTAVSSMTVAGPSAGPLVSVENLVAAYRGHDESPYQKLRHSSRLAYEANLKRIVNDWGKQLLAGLKKQEIEAQYNAWLSTGKRAMAHSLITMFRGLIHFGAGTLRDPECERLVAVLHNMYFSPPRGRSEFLTADHVKKIIDMAHKMGWHSIALAQAFQFEIKLHQRDVIGEWVPTTEPGEPDVLSPEGDEKWIRGLTWSEIDKDFVLRHRDVTNKVREVNLNLAPTVMKELKRELERLVTRPVSGPVIVSEFHHQPWTAHEYRRRWRQVADACGIPKGVQNGSSRPAKKNSKPDENETHRTPSLDTRQEDLESAPTVRH